MRIQETACIAGLSGRPLWKAVVGYVLTIALIGYCVQFAWWNWDHCVRMLTVNPLWLPVLTFVLAITLLARAVYMSILVQVLGKEVSSSDCFCLVAATEMLSMVAPPASGGAYRAYYMWRYHGVDVVPFVSGTALFILAGVLIWSAGGIVGLLAGGPATETMSPVLLPVAIAGVIPMYCLWRIMSRRLASGHPRWNDRVLGISFRDVNARRLIGVALATATVCVVTQIAGLSLTLRIFGFSAGVTESAVIMSSHQLSGVMGVTPGSVGIQEGAGAFIAGRLGFDLAGIAIVFTLMRVGRLGLSILIGGPCWWLLSRHSHRVPRSDSRDLSPGDRQAVR